MYVLYYPFLLLLLILLIINIIITFFQDFHTILGNDVKTYANGVVAIFLAM